MFEFLTGGAGNGNGAIEAIDAPAGSVLVETPGAVSIKEAPTVRVARPTLGLALGGGAAVRRAASPISASCARSPRRD